MIRRIADFLLVTIGGRARFWPKELVRRGAKSGVPTLVVVPHFSNERGGPHSDWYDFWLSVDGKSRFRIRRWARRRVYVVELDGGWHEVAIRVAAARLVSKFEIAPSESALLVVVPGIRASARSGEMNVSVRGADGEELRSYSGVWTED